MSKMGRISHARIEALEKEIAALKQRLVQVEAHPALSVPVLHGPTGNPAGVYIPQFDRWPGNER